MDCFKSTGKITTEVRTIPAYTGLDVRDNINVYITESEESSIRVKAGENLLENIVTEVRDRTLYIENSNKCNWIRTYKAEVDVYLNTKSLNNISFRGFGKVETIGTYNSQHFFVDMWEASGDMKLKLDCDSVFLKSHTGSANIECSGNAGVSIFYMSGTGIINASELKSSYLLAINRDVGDLHVNATEFLDAEIYSRGDIFYRGNPKKIELEDLGEGELIQN